MKSSITATNVTLDYPVYSVRAKSLRGALANVAVGGLLFRTRSDQTVVRALSSVSFHLNEGDRLGIVGHNGSGKSSLLKLLAGIYEPSGGNVRMVGRVASMLSMSIGLDPEASGVQNIINLGLMQMLSMREIKQIMPSIIEFSELGPYIMMPFKTYSAGMMARLTFAVATSVSSDILLLDEWLGAGDAAFQEKATERMRRFVESAGIVVLASHSPSLIQNVCNKVLVLESGKPTFFGATTEWGSL